jgi:uncharacterized membrane protein YcaP (DUF421 family)
VEIILRATATFFFLYLLTRALGKRGLAEMTPFELLLLVVVGDLIQQGTTQEDFSITGAMLAVGTIGMWIVVFSYVGFRWGRVREAVEGVPLLVVLEGRPLMDVLHVERLPLEELLEAAREQGIGDLSEVRAGVLEPDGKLSFIKRTSDDDNRGSRDHHRA